ncbi:MAG: adenylate/guanylate cyclase domain-containing protein [Albidovulum sp.]
MDASRQEISRTLIDGISTWLRQSALNGSDLETITCGICERLSAIGIPLARVHVTFSMLHPLYTALGFTWLRGQPVEIEGYNLDTKKAPPERYLSSPYYQLVSKNLSHLRRRISPTAPPEFPVFEDIKHLGITDYLAFKQSFGDAEEKGMLGSWATDAGEGFSEEMIKALLHIQNNFAVAAQMAVLRKLAGNMLTTYLGGNAGERVLSGQIRRGDGETVRAALVMVDMRSSTALAENGGRQVFIDTLNEFFDAVATPFNRDGGEILSFVGDGFLAVYPCERQKLASQTAARAAMNAARTAVIRMQALNRNRAERGLDEIRFGIGLHVGNVMYGNVGLQSRLTFSAFGAAVNEVQRLESLTKKFNHPIVASEMFKDYCDGDWQFAGQEELRGVPETVSVFLPGPKNMACDGATDMTFGFDEKHSQAEELILLHRNALVGKTDSVRRLNS